MQNDVIEVLRTTATTHATRTALVDDARSWTYAQLLGAVDRRAEQLRSLIRPEDVVAIGHSNNADFVVDFLAVRVIGAVTVLVGPAGASAPGTSLGVTMRIDASGATRVRDRPPAWLEQCPETSVLLFTSGTTAAPKAVAHSDISLLWGMWNTVSIGDEILYGSAQVPATDDEMVRDLLARAIQDPFGLVFCPGLPLWTVSGLTILQRALLRGDTLTLLERFDAGRFASLAELRPANFALSPYMAKALVREIDNRARRGDWRGVATGVGIGGGSVEPSLVERLEQVLACRPTVGYGSTETGGVITTSRPTDDIDVRAHSVGRPVPSVRLRSVGTDAHTLECRTPASMLGYVVGDMFLPAAQWIDMGDRVSVRADENLVIEGRADWLILRGARLIDPVVIERALETHPSVARAGVLGVSNERTGAQDIVALVEPVTSAVLSSSSLRKQCIDLGVAFPQVIREVEHVPTTADGAVQRAALRNMI